MKLRVSLCSESDFSFLDDSDVVVFAFVFNFIPTECKSKIKSGITCRPSVSAYSEAQNILYSRGHSLSIFSQHFCNYFLKFPNFVMTSSRRDSDSETFQSRVYVNVDRRWAPHRCRCEYTTVDSETKLFYFRQIWIYKFRNAISCAVIMNESRADEFDEQTNQIWKISCVRFDFNVKRMLQSICGQFIQNASDIVVNSRWPQTTTFVCSMPICISIKSYNIIQYLIHWFFGDYRTT